MSLTRRFLAMVEAAMVAADPSSAMGIAEGREFAHDQVYRVLQEESYCFSMLVLDQLRAIGALKGGYLVLDDSFILRYSSGKLKLKKLKDSAHNRYAYGFNVVLLIWTDGQRRIPVGFRVFTAKKGEQSKIELALELFKEAQAFGMKPSYVLFDAWYAAQQIVNWLIGAGWLYVTQLRSNRKLDGSSLKSYNHPYWVKVGKLNHVKSKVMVIRHGKRFFCTNDLSLDRKQIQGIYRFRQQVEEAFRSLKQEMGWEGMRFSTLQTLTAHLGLALSAYTLIEVQRYRTKQTFYKYRRGLISGRIKPLSLVPNGFPLAA